MLQLIEIIFSLVFLIIAVILFYKLQNSDKAIKKTHKAIKITYDYNFGDGWTGMDVSNRKYYNRFDAMPNIQLYYKNNIITNIDKYKQIKIDEKKIVIFSYSAGEEPECITNDHNGGEIGLLFKDNEFYTRTEIKEKFINNTFKNDYETVLINGELLKKEKKELDLKKTKRHINYKPIYKNEKKELLELFEEIYKFINYYEEREGLC